MASDLPASISERDQQLTALFSQPGPPRSLTEASHLMIEMLHIAVHGDTWARPDSPREVWLGLLADVHERFRS